MLVRPRHHVDGGYSTSDAHSHSGSVHLPPLRRVLGKLSRIPPEVWSEVARRQWNEDLRRPTGCPLCHLANTNVRLLKGHDEAHQCPGRPDRDRYWGPASRRPPLKHELANRRGCWFWSSWNTDRLEQSLAFRPDTPLCGGLPCLVLGPGLPFWAA